MAKRGKGKKLGIPGLITIIIIVAFSFVFGESDPGSLTNSYKGDGETYVHVIDVGQGSSTLIQEGNKGILIDTGEDDFGEYLVSYINSCGVDELEYVIASHPHSDHIGCITDVFEAFKIGTVVMPELSEENIPTTRIYEKMMEYIIDNDLDVLFPEIGDSISLGQSQVTFYGPAEQTDDLNNMSLICKIDASGTGIMALGDAEKPELSSSFGSVKGGYKSDILLMGHHGSRTSVYKPYLDAVDADVAVISCGKKNSYGHPHKEALNYVSERGMKLYRTDKEGDIVFRCNSEGYEKVD